MTSGNSIVTYYVTAGETPTAEDERAIEWLASAEGFEPLMLHMNDLPAEPAGHKPPVLWIHIVDAATLDVWRWGRGRLGRLRSWFDGGGRLLLTDFAAALPFDMGIESVQPACRIRPVRDRGFGRKLGFQSYAGHPVFRSFHGGVYIWDAFEDHETAVVGYFDGSWPREGRIVGVEKSYITIDADSRLLVDYSGRALAVGGFVYFARENVLRAHLERFMADVIRYLGGAQGGTQRTYWNKRDPEPKSFSVTPDPLDVRDVLLQPPQPDAVLTEPDQRDVLLHPPQPEAVPVEPDQRDVRQSVQHGPSAPEIVVSPGQACYREVAGRRCVALGSGGSCIDEFWTYPFRALRELRTGVIEDDHLLWLDEFRFGLVVRPESVERSYRLQGGTLIEEISASVDRPGVLVRYTGAGGRQRRLLITFTSDLRWMWPYPPSYRGGVRYAFDEVLGAYHVRDEDGECYCLFGSRACPVDHLAGSFGRVEYRGGSLVGTGSGNGTVRFALSYDLGGVHAAALDFAAAGSPQGPAEAKACYRSMLASPGATVSTARRHYRELDATGVQVDAPDPLFKRSSVWALAAADRFRARTPGLGAGLLAGFASSDAGWDGGHEASGRPGYAWYFGRDAAWASLALDACGAFDAVREQLELFRRYQDIDGKIFHELTLSGAVHYDAADATPLYVILAADYLRASGDVDCIRDLWPSLRKAMAFCSSTDRNGDGLIENTHVGHGWVEGGVLFGAHCTIYLAGLWAQALSDAACIARVLDAEADWNWHEDAMRVREIIDRKFWNESTGFFDHSLRRDGSSCEEKTIMPAVLMGFGLLDDDKTGCMLDEFAGNAFSTDWGLRLLSAESPHFNPAGYHSGSVWPLFTGWVSLAEYRSGRPVQGFTHLMNNVTIRGTGAPGYTAEVLHGKVFEPAGVCPHQCWSETSTLSATISGMIGFNPDLPAGRLVLEPRFPVHWDAVRVSGLRVGRARLEMSFEREGRRTTYQFDLVGGSGVDVIFTPQLFHGAEITRIGIEGAERNAAHGRARGISGDSIYFRLRERALVVIESAGGIEMVPSVPAPKPGRESAGFRIINSGMAGGEFRVTLEGRAGANGMFRLRCLDGDIASCTGGELGEAARGIRPLSVSFDGEGGEFVRKTVRMRPARGSKR
jgi:glycogen debranching enzyme